MFVSFRCSWSRSVPRRPHQRPIWLGAPGERQGGGPANHLTGTPQDASWSTSASQHQVSKVEVLPGEPSQFWVLRTQKSHCGFDPEVLSTREFVIYEPSCVCCRYWPLCQTVRVKWPFLTTRCSSAVAMPSATPTLMAVWSLHWACSGRWGPHFEACNMTGRDSTTWHLCANNQWSPLLTKMH